MTDAIQASYPHLLSPLSVRNLHLRNRMVMGAMHTRLESMDRPVSVSRPFTAPVLQARSV
jgi:2,4-dienoyl-CoA reductase-like NADH-dependent reductase (Old Yellow Enzyme family)